MAASDDRETEQRVADLALRRELLALHARSFAWTMCCCGYQRQEAEDVLQTVYLKIAEGKARFGGRSSLKTWLFAVIRNTAAQQRRWAFVRRPRRQQPDPVGTPEQSLQQAETADQVRRGLLKLSRRQREILELVFYQELTIEAAAKVSGVSLGTARTHYKRGKAAMLQQLQERP